MSGERDTYQPPLEGISSSETEGDVSFAAGTTIFLEQGGRGDLRGPIEAKKLSKKIKGLSGFEAVTRIDLEYKAWNARYWSMPSGTRFGAWSKSAHKIKK